MSEDDLVRALAGKTPFGSHLLKDKTLIKLVRKLGKNSWSTKEYAKIGIFKYLKSKYPYVENIDILYTDGLVEVDIMCNDDITTQLILQKDKKMVTSLSVSLVNEDNNSVVIQIHDRDAI